MRLGHAARSLFSRRGAGSERPAEAERTGPRIAVIGNCQARAVVQAARILAPSAQVSLVPMGEFGKARRSLKALADDLRSFDHIFTQPFTPGLFPEGGSDDLVAAVPRTRTFPAIVFTAFHPDAVYVGDLDSMADTRLVPSPLHTYHSAIALFGYLRGLTPARILPLYREEVFRHLDYLDAWPRAAADLLAAGEAIGFDLGPDFQRWSRSGAFMHNINHPRLHVLGDVAARLLEQSGITPARVPLESYLADDLVQDVIWPVYEPIAAVYGVKGSYLFKRRQKRGEPPSLVDLERMVSESLAIYASIPRERLRCHRVELWAQREDIREIFEAA